MADIETKIRRTLRLVREAIRAVEADPAVFREAVRRVRETAANPLLIPADDPEIVLRQIERVLASALAALETSRQANYPGL